MWKGGGRGYEDVIMVTLGTGVGGGVILNGRMVAGSNGAGGEIGHMIVNSGEEDACGCGGHGHLEQYASATGIVRMAKKKLANDDAPTKLREYGELSAKIIFDCAKEGDLVALELVDELGRYLALALSHVAATVDPQVFVIGGGVSRAGEILIDAQGKGFCLAELGNDAGIYGSAWLAAGI